MVHVGMVQVGIAWYRLAQYSTGRYGLVQVSWFFSYWSSKIVRKVLLELDEK